MDEAERCHRIACLAYGNLLVRGTVSEVVEAAHLATWSVAEVVPFGSTIHVSGHDAAKVEAALGRHCAAGNVRTRIESSLEDVFIGLMDQAKDNFG
jgi:ABC-2 type transport system ATP-binding protein